MSLLCLNGTCPLVLSASAIVTCGGKIKTPPEVAVANKTVRDGNGCRLEIAKISANNGSRGCSKRRQQCRVK